MLKISLMLCRDFSWTCMNHQCHRYLVFPTDRALCRKLGSFQVLGIANPSVSLWPSVLSSLMQFSFLFPFYQTGIPALSHTVVFCYCPLVQLPWLVALIEQNSCLKGKKKKALPVKQKYVIQMQSMLKIGGYWIIYPEQSTALTLPSFLLSVCSMGGWSQTKPNETGRHSLC